MAARFLAGVAAGVAWSLLAGYARRLAPPELSGRAIAVAMTGVPIALSLGVPAGTFLGNLLDWRAAFGAISLLALGVIGWVLVSVADFPGAPRTAGAGGRAGAPSLTMLGAARLPGVPAVLAVTLVFVLAHTVMYAYVDTYLEAAAMGDRADLTLLVFGLASVVGVWLVGRHIDRELRALTIASIVLVAAATLVLTVTRAPVAVYVAAAAWGLGWGGAPTLLQSAGVAAGGRHSAAAGDAAQSMLVTLWNLAMALGGTVGGILLELGGASALPATTALLGIPALLVVVAARRHGFVPALAVDSERATR
jgi:predicted MFS family arabinose efflux permease